MKQKENLQVNQILLFSSNLKNQVHFQNSASNYIRKNIQHSKRLRKNNHMTGKISMVTGYKRELLWIAIKLRIFYLTCAILKSPGKILKSFKLMGTIRNNIWGGNM